MSDSIGSSQYIQLQPLKQCSTCGQYFPPNLDYWHKHKNKHDGLSSTCKVCAKARAKKWYENNREKALENVRRFRINNPQIIKERNHDYYIRNVARHRKSTLNWQKHNRTKVNLWTKRWRDNNKARIRQLKKRWRKQNPDKERATKQLRRTRKHNAGGFFTSQEVRRLYVEQNGQCFHCGIDISAGYHCDHWIPLAKGGTNWIANIRLLCPHCNFSKGSKLPCEWCPERYLSSSK